MNILILYPFYNQRRLMHYFSSRLRENGIYADVLCVGNYSYEKSTDIQWPKLVERCFNYLNTSEEGWLKRIVRKVVHQFLLSKLFSHYGLIDFHAYYPSYNHLMSDCEKNKVKFDITLWGSDVMRAGEERKRLLCYGFDNCHRIKMSDNLHDIMLEYYGSVYDNKSRIVYFGNSDLPEIDALTDTEAKVIKDKMYGDMEGKKIVVCGYNGYPSQNHPKMIESLSALNDEERSSIHVVLPMTYGAKADYLNEIRRKMEELSISYTILDSFLEAKEVAALRKTADIVINVQNTDAIAGSLQDHLYCGNVCIFGEWLNYSVYTNNQIYYIKTSMDGIAGHLKEVLAHYSKFQAKCVGNHDKIKALLSWEATIAKQVAVYGE